MKPLNRTQKVSIVVGSLIVGLLMVLDKPQRSKGSVIRLLQLLRTKIRVVEATKEERKILSEICRDAMMMLVEQHKGEKSTLHVATFIETLSFDFEKELTEFFGKDYIVTMIRFCEKQSNDGEIHESYELADNLRDNIRKFIYDRTEK